MARENCVIVSQVKGLCHSNRSFIGLKLIAQCEKRIALIFVTYLRLSFSNHDEIRCYWYVPPTAWFQLWSVSLQRRVIAAAGGANLSGHRNTENLHRWPHLLSNLGYRADWLERSVATRIVKKICYLAPSIFCCGAGTATDTENVTDMVSSELALHRYATGRESHVVTALTTLKSRLFWFLLMDPDTLSFATMGSGALAAMCVFESR